MEQMTLTFFFDDGGSLLVQIFGKEWSNWDEAWGLGDPKSHGLLFTLIRKLDPSPIPLRLVNFHSGISKAARLNGYLATSVKILNSSQYYLDRAPWTPGPPGASQAFTTTGISRRSSLRSSPTTSAWSQTASFSWPFASQARPTRKDSKLSMFALVYFSGGWCFSTTEGRRDVWLSQNSIHPRSSFKPERLNPEEFLLLGKKTHANDSNPPAPLIGCFLLGLKKHRNTKTTSSWLLGFAWFLHTWKPLLTTRSTRPDLGVL